LRLQIFKFYFLELHFQSPPDMMLMYFICSRAEYVQIILMSRMNLDHTAVELAGVQVAGSGPGGCFTGVCL
jgi:hypothetical protein